jgi:hypothetical protein
MEKETTGRKRLAQACGPCRRKKVKQTNTLIIKS